MNPKRLRRFSPTEQEAIKKVARGGSLKTCCGWSASLRLAATSRRC
jgi:hypothetical protein